MFDMSLEDLMQLDVTIATNTTMTRHESPGIISVITAEEIHYSGADDLMSILRLVPGMEMNVDVWGVTGLSIRGNIGYAGRVLFMIDGQELNELQYSCVLLGGHYPVDNIARIEIIRGPGSSVYGGFAELGVVNIITRSGNDVDGVSVTTRYGQMEDAISHASASVSAGRRTGDAEYVLHGFFNRGSRSNKTYTDAYGGSYGMSDNSGLRSFLLNGAVEYRGLRARIIYDDYVVETRDWYDEALSKTYDVMFRSVMGEASYDWRISDKLTLTPRYNLLINRPWSTLDDLDSADPVYYKADTKSSRNRFNLSARYDLDERVNIVAGGELRFDSAKNKTGDDFSEHLFWDGGSEMDYRNISGFVQGIVMSDLANITLGGRVDSHDTYGTAFAPRLGITKVVDGLHMKLLLSQAYRSPSTREIDFYISADPDNTTPDIESEETRVVEFEAGYQSTANTSVTLNLFHTRVDKPIVYMYLDDGDGYINAGRSGTKGLDLEARLRGERGYVTASYSYYDADGINDVDYYEVPGHSGALLGTAQHKATIYGHLEFKRAGRFSVNPSLMFLGRRYCYDRYDAALDAMAISEKDPQLLLNLNLDWSDVFMKGFGLGLGVSNITDADDDFLQPYDGWHPPLPGSGRRYTLKLTCDFGS